MTEQTKAQRLADLLDAEQLRTVSLDIMHNDAATELRRLDALNAELAAALQWYVDTDDVIESMAGNEPWIEGKHKAQAALAKAKEQT